MKFKGALLIPLIFSSLTGLTIQQGLIDSLENNLVNSSNAKQKVIALNNLAWNLSHKSPDKAIEYGNQAIAICQEMNFKEQLIKAFDFIGTSYKNKGEMDKSVEHHEMALKLALEINDRGLEGQVLNNIGIVYMYRGNYQKALQHYIQANKIYNEEGNSSGIIDNMINISLVYYYQQNYEKAIEYNKKVVFLSAKSDKEKDRAKGLKGLINIGAAFYFLENLDSAIYYFSQALKYGEKIGDDLQVARSLNNIAEIYVEQEKYQEALKYLNKSLLYKEKLGDKKGIAATLMNLGALYSRKRDYKKASDHVLRGLEIARSMGIPELEKSAYQKLSWISSEQGNYQKAFYYQERFIELKDSIMNIEKEKAIAEIETKFEKEKDQLQIENLKKEKLLQDTEIKRQTIRTIAFASGFGLTLLLALVAIRGYRNKQKANRLLGEKNNIIEEKNKDITDSINYAKNIQQAILPFESRMKKALPEHFVLFKPKDIVSGDFYWFMEKEEKIFLSVVDCTGHGVPGAFMSMIGSAILTHIVGEQKITRPDLILNEMHNQVRTSLKQQENNNRDGMDLCLVAIDKKNKKLEFAGAMNPLYLVKNGTIETIKGDKTPIGGSQDEEERIFTLHTIALEEPATIHLSTDGFADQFGGPKGKKFKYKQFKELLLSVQNKSMKEQKQIIHETFEDWKGDLEQIDDVCVIGVRI